MDRIVLVIAGSSGALEQLVVYSCRKRKKSLQYQASNILDGLIQHVYGPLEGHRYYWTVYVQSGL